MGFDVSYHPVDLDLIRDRIVPFVRGDGSLDEWARDAVTREKVRWRAKAWALGMLDLNRKLLEGASEEATLPTGAFQSDLHVWGRPFFVGAETPPSVSAAIDRWMAVEPSEVDALAKAALEEIAPAVAHRVEPNVETGPPPDDELAKSVMAELVVLAKACKALKKGKTEIALPDGTTAAPAELLAKSFPLYALAFSARFRPGWMARGRVWPSLLVADAGLDAARFFQSPLALFGELENELPGVAAGLESTITENYMVGGFVSTEKVPELRETFKREREAILKKPKDEGWDLDCTLALRKIDEALVDAERRGLPFAEASEVYSGPMGIMN